MNGLSQQKILLDLLLSIKYKFKEETCWVCFLGGKLNLLVIRCYVSF